MSNRGSTQKGPIQPHYIHLPRHRPKTRSSLDHTNALGSHYSGSQPKGLISRTQTPHVGLNSSSVPTESTTSASFGDRIQPLHTRRDDATPLTSPSEIILPFDTLPQKFPAQPSSQPRIAPAEAGSSPDLHPRITPLIDAGDMDKMYRSLTRAHVRGPLEPRVGNLPRRRRRTHKEGEQINRRCLQELFKGSGVWVAFNPSFSEGDEEGGSSLKLSNEETNESDWIWEERFGFTAVIRVRVSEVHGECQREIRGNERREELELIIGREQGKIHDAAGVSALSRDQLEIAAKFLADNRQRRDRTGKVLITVPASRPVEALSIALLGFSLPSPSLPNLPPFLSQLRFLPGVVELEQAQNTWGSDFLGFGAQAILPKYSSIQLALWHLHDLTPPDEAGEDSNELKPEWRGALSVDGIEKLEGLIAP